MTGKVDCFILRNDDGWAAKEQIASFFAMTMAGLQKSRLLHSSQ
jgi:hypothetical protein